MNHARRQLVLAVSLTPLALAAGRVFAQANGAFNELKPPLHVESEGKIEVLEFFWYGCIHCYNLEPKIDAWLKTLPKDVQFRRVPAVLSDRWGHDATIFYAFEAMGLLDKLHRPLFEAIHVNRLRTDNAASLNGWLEKQGLDPKKVNEVARSFGVQSKVKRAIRLTSDYRIEGTPAMAVHGRYTVPASDAMFDTVNQLVAAVRKNKQ
ncbi:MAG TPA: thiol:disulfide interchange protein DsbA/DsbL [Burkholderiales bacterium]|nr:thiol:disulfide interchange protein DsbA/DsbL [Burkholderiales bacterium]